MYFRLFPLLAIAVCGILVLPSPDGANALTPLTRAEIQYLKNLVQLMRKNNPAVLPARKADTLTPGDGLATGRSSLADLRFNDGSLARVGEQALFQFLPQTRDFSLSNGTMLLLIPPGGGQTRVRTPNAAAAIRGSALFVRYNKETDTTIIGALTNSGIEVSNKAASQSQVLQAGQLMVVTKGQFQGLYDFDLRNFYETSSLVRGLDLTRKNPQVTQNDSMVGVKAEIATAIATQSPVVGPNVVNNPPFARNSSSHINPPNQNMTTGNFPKNILSPTRPPVNPGELLQSTQTAIIKSTPPQTPTVNKPPTPPQPPTQTSTPTTNGKPTNGTTVQSIIQQIIQKIIQQPLVK